MFVMYFKFQADLVNIDGLEAQKKMSKTIDTDYSLFELFRVILTT